jgi:hypothetical protein
MAWSKRFQSFVNLTSKNSVSGSILLITYRDNIMRIHEMLLNYWIFAQVHKGEILRNLSSKLRAYSKKIDIILWPPGTVRQFMDANSGLRTMIEEGRGKLEWERKIPDEKLSELKDLLSVADFKANIPKVRRYVETEYLQGTVI